MKKRKPWRIVLLLVLLGIVLAGGVWLRWMKSADTSNKWNASCVGNIPAPIGYKRVPAQAGDYTTFPKAAKCSFTPAGRPTTSGYRLRW